MVFTTTAVAERDRPGELRQHVGALGTVAEVDLDALQPGALLEQPHDLAGAERRHAADYGRATETAMRRSTRSSRDLNGSLHSTVRCAWSLSFRCTQSTV